MDTSVVSPLLDKQAKLEYQLNIAKDKFENQGIRPRIKTNPLQPPIDAIMHFEEQLDVLAEKIQRAKNGMKPTPVM